MKKVTDETDYCIHDASNGPGDTVARVAKAKPAKALTPTLQKTLDNWNRKSDRSIGHTSKALAYGFRFMPKSEHNNMIRLIKGGHLKVCRIEGKPPEGSNAKSGSPYSDRYYVIRESCPPEMPEGSLYGTRRRRR